MQIGGKLAQLGSRPIDSMARKLAAHSSKIVPVPSPEVGP
jgi:carbon monoxide dehydrogenase subunit G